jgi:hypothetical protein
VPGAKEAAGIGYIRYVVWDANACFERSRLADSRGLPGVAAVRADYGQTVSAHTASLNHIRCKVGAVSRCVFEIVRATFAGLAGGGHSQARQRVG